MRRHGGNGTEGALRVSADDRDGGPGTVRDLASLGEITPEMLAATFASAGWRKPKHVAGGGWITMRSGTQDWFGPRSLIRMALSAPDLGSLAEKLEVQAWLDRLDPEELAEAWLSTGQVPGSVPAPERS